MSSAISEWLELAIATGLSYIVWRCWMSSHSCLIDTHCVNLPANTLVRHDRFQADRLSMAVMDIDHFKTINETQRLFDEAIKCLSEFGVWLKRFVRDEDMIARWASEEFVFLLSNCEASTALTLMERIQKRLEQFSPANVSITVSIGIATVNDNNKHSLNSLFELADSAMYRAKMSGRNCIRIYDAGKEVEEPEA